MGLLEYQAMPSLRDVARDGFLSTFSNRSAPDRGKWCGPSGQAAWTVHRVQNHTLLGSLSSCQPDRRAALLGQTSSLRPHFSLLSAQNFQPSVQPMVTANVSANR